MLILPVLLIVFPFVASVGIFCARSDRVRSMAVAASALCACVGAILLLAPRLAAAAIDVSLNEHSLSLLVLLVELGMALFIVVVGVRMKRPLISALAAIQAAVMVWFECAYGSQVHVTRNLFVDQLAVIMALINGVVGGGICLYALQYMREYHGGDHPDVRDRRPLFFTLLFVFMGAMFGLIFANNLLWLGLFWEITTLCSFLLIGYAQTEKARKNALQALVMNLAGGLAFSVAVVWFFRTTGEADLQSLIATKQSLALLPAALFCFAGMTKSAQLPFSSWLLGAMVAPTPVSALLHSSTMVKAGVYLILRMSPIVANTRVGMALAVIGGLTFVVGSFSAITTSNAKRVLAHSTIANLGLIVLCGGLGSSQAIWAAIFLIIFHAVSKCLLFLCVGLVEHRLHSRDIEDMSGLILKMPWVAVMMLVGMAGMFLAPFGMLIGKWAVLKAVMDRAPLLSIFIVFGGSATLFFWAKWMGKLLQVIHPDDQRKPGLSTGELIATGGLTVATFCVCLFFPLLSSRLVEPYVRTVFGQSGAFAPGNLIVMDLMMTAVLLFPFSLLPWGRRVKVVESYLAGANYYGNARFVGAAGAAQDVVMGNYYLHELFNEAWLARWGTALCGLLLTVMIVMAML